MKEDLIWAQKGATLSDKSAREEYGLTQEQLIAAMRSQKLQFRVGSMHGNPWYRLLRKEVEALLAEQSGPDHLHQQKLRKELADLIKEAKKLTARLKVVDRRKTELMSELEPP